MQSPFCFFEAPMYDLILKYVGNFNTRNTDRTIYILFCMDKETTV